MLSSLFGAGAAACACDRALRVNSLCEHGRKATPKGQTWNSLGAILSAQPDGGDSFLRTHLPPPVRLLWKWVGARKYAKTRAALEGR